MVFGAGRFMRSRFQLFGITMQTKRYSVETAAGPIIVTILPA
jgi:hypothetical protein